MQVPRNFPDRRVCIVGLGYVGLTLAVAMAEAGFEVYGVERSATIVEAVQSGRAHFSESGLDLRLAAQVKSGRLTASFDMPRAGECRVFIITVGTPIGDEHKTDLKAIKTVAALVRDRLQPGDMVIARSTVRVGVSRDVIQPVLAEAGVPFDLAFCPERTLEGKALLELRSLPQIVGGLTDDSVLRATNLFNFITPTTIKVRDLETAEMIKLVNNTQRDLLFAFANEIAQLCDTLGVSAPEVIRAGNMGYSRAFMPEPGPVGGPCLSKDPYILAESVALKGGEVGLTLLGRRLNEAVPAQAVRTVSELLSEARDASEVRSVGIAGLAFKGRPETSDLRGTLAIALIDELRKQFPAADVVGYDPAVPCEDIETLGIAAVDDAERLFSGAQAVLFQNNNPQFQRLDLNHLSTTMAPGAVIYDLWNQFEPSELVLASGVRYCGLGSRVIVSAVASQSIDERISAS